MVLKRITGYKESQFKIGDRIASFWHLNFLYLSSKTLRCLPTFSKNVHSLILFRIFSKGFKGKKNITQFTPDQNIKRLRQCSVKLHCSFSFPACIALHSFCNIFLAHAVLWFCYSTPLCTLSHAINCRKSIFIIIEPVTFSSRLPSPLPHLSDPVNSINNAEAAIHKCYFWVTKFVSMPRCLGHEFLLKSQVHFENKSSPTRNIRLPCWKRNFNSLQTRTLRSMHCEFK